MLRAIAKATLLGGFGLVPGGARRYQIITRDWMGTQATHVDKLARVWPGYVEQWVKAGLEMEGLRVWVHGGGWTPFPFLVNYLLTGDAGVVTNTDGRVSDQYLSRAVNGALGCGLPGSPQDSVRRAQMESLRWFEHASDAIAELGGELFEGISVDSVPIGSDTVDLCHSGGTLEHVAEAELRAFLREAERILRPGGVMSHVFDHRDHLHHVDPDWPWLGHLRLSPVTYRLLFGHRLMYHNRLLPTQVAGLFESAGFERIAIRRLVMPSHEYVDSAQAACEGSPGVSRSRLSRTFRDASDVDLRTAAAHYLYRKP